MIHQGYNFLQKFSFWQKSPFFPRNTFSKKLSIQLLFSLPLRPDPVYPRQLRSDLILPKSAYKFLTAARV